MTSVRHELKWMLSEGGCAERGAEGGLLNKKPCWHEANGQESRFKTVVPEGGLHLT